jgi:hypothetical protein
MVIFSPLFVSAQLPYFVGGSGDIGLDFLGIEAGRACLHSGDEGLKSLSPLLLLGGQRAAEQTFGYRVWGLASLPGLLSQQFVHLR